MDQNVLVSIIVPVYNTEKFLNKCIDSIINQTYKNLEIILINDNSTGNEEEICKSYNDKRIKYKKILDPGVSYARNAGLDLSSGKYILFVDSDDYLEKDYVEILLKSAIKYDADVVECGYNRISEEGNYLYNKVPKDYFEDDNYKINKNFLELIYFENMLWNKIFKRDVISNIKFKSYSTSEDYNFLTNVYLNVKKKKNISNCLYNYRDNSKSICNTDFSRKKLDVIYSREESFNIYKKLNYEYLYNYVAMRIVYYVFDFYPKTNDKEIKNELKAIFNNYYKYALKLNAKNGGYKLNFKSKIFKNVGYLLFKYFPNMFIKLKSFIK